MEKVSWVLSYRLWTCVTLVCSTLWNCICLCFQFVFFSSWKLFFFLLRNKSERKYIILKYSEYFEYEVSQQSCSLVHSPLKKWLSSLTNTVSSFWKAGADWQWFKVFSVDFMRKKYFSQYDFKVDFFPPITLHVGSKLALREYCAHHSSLLMYWGVSFGSFSSVRPLTDVVHVFCFCTFERLSFDREGDVEKKKPKHKKWLAKWWYHQMFKDFANWSLLGWHFVFYSALIGIMPGCMMWKVLNIWVFIMTKWQKSMSRMP